MVLSGREEHRALQSDPSGYASRIFLGAEPLPAPSWPLASPASGGNLTACPFPAYSLQAPLGPSPPTVQLQPGAHRPIHLPTLSLSCAVTVPRARRFVPSCSLFCRSALHPPNLCPPHPPNPRWPLAGCRSTRARASGIPALRAPARASRQLIYPSKTLRRRMSCHSWAVTPAVQQAHESSAEGTRGVGSRAALTSGLICH